MIPEVVILQDWPACLGEAEAARYLGISKSQLVRVVRENPGKLPTFNLLPNGDTMFRRETLDEFLAYRERVGVERRSA